MPIALTALAGTLWRAAILLNKPGNPDSSIIGYVVLGTRTIEELFNRDSRANTKNRLKTRV